ncbi:hypothetical protein KJ966_04675 [bacterium]|nr:hypothetical protein [bacterium]
MKLEFENGLIDSDIYKELGFEGFLALFQREIPMVGHTILKPMERQSALEHFQRLIQLDSQIRVHQADLAALVQQGARLPSLEAVLPFFRDGVLEPYHLFELGQFVSEELDLRALEISFPLPTAGEICRTLTQILRKYTTRDYSNLIFSTEEEAVQKSITLLNQQLQKALKQVEKEIFQQTGLKMVYPFSREIGKDDEKLKSVKACSYLQISEGKEFLTLDFVPDDAIIRIVTEKSKREKEWNNLMACKLETLNSELKEHYEAFSDYYQCRSKRLFDYILLETKEQHQLCFPKLHPTPLFKLEKGVLPSLRKINPGSYNPLTLEIKNGVSLLYGANMTGKTTVLKTVFFHLMCVKVGLPIPADSLTLSFPNQLGLRLKSSGKTQTGLSGFGEELQFFCREDVSPSFYMVDELFHSTDPVSGVELSQAFCEEYADSESLYFFTSHYPEVLNSPNVAFFRMKDIPESGEIENLEEFLQKVPFEVEPITADKLKGSLKSGKQSIRVALHFPLSDSLKQKLRKKLDG